MVKAKQTTASVAPVSLNPSAISQIQEVSNNSKVLLTINNLRVCSSDIPPALCGNIKFDWEKTKTFSIRLSASLNDKGPGVHIPDITFRLLQAPSRARLNLMT